jgi:type I restriction enzyme, R subunit
MTTYNVVASTSESTVVSEYKFDATRSTDYQSEADLEKEFIQILASQGYESSRYETNKI